MKYVYVLSSSEDDYYTEQALISIYSLRRYNPDAYVILFVDQVTIRTLENERSRIKEFVDEIITVSTPSELNFLQRSRYIKTSLRQLLTGDFLYLDTDTIILGNLKKLEGMKCEMGAVPLQDSDEWGLNNIHPQLRSYNNYRSLPENENHSIRKYYNGGVFLCRDTIKVHKFFETWHKGWLESSQNFHYHKDQPDLWIANAKINNLISEINGLYNFQINCFNKIPYNIFNCKIFHYIATSRYCQYLKVRTPEFLIQTRKEGITEETDRMLENIKTEYLKGLEIREILDKENDSSLILIIKYLENKFPKLTKSLDKGIKKVLKKPLNKSL